MDRITKSLLDEFSVDHDLVKLSEDRQFEHFAGYLTVGRFLAESFDTSDIATGSGSDTGIDGIAIIVNGSLVTDAELVSEYASRNGYIDAMFILFQADRSASFEAAKIGKFDFGVQDFFKEKPTLPRNKEVSAAAKVMSAVFAHSSKFKRGNPACKLYYVTTGSWVNDAVLDARRTAVIAGLEATRLFRDVEFAPIDASTIQKLYHQSKNAVARDFEFAQRTVVPDIPGVSEAYLGLLPAKEFINLIEDDRGGAYPNSCVQSS